MKAYIAYIRISLRLTARERLVIFFNYLFPLVFLVGFGEIMNAARPGLRAGLRPGADPEHPRHGFLRRGHARHHGPRSRHSAPF